MGILFSRPIQKKTPFEILGIPPISTKEEIRERFIKLIKISSDRQEIISAYDSIKNSPPDLDLYTAEILSEEKYFKDLFQKIGDYCGLAVPKEREEIYKMFKNFQSSRRFKTEKERIEFNYKVRKIVKECSIDSIDSSIDNIDSISSIDTYRSTTTEKQFKCEECKKGFRSINQLLNHYRSKKHLREVEKIEKEPKEFIKKQIENVDSSKDSTKDSTKDSSKDITKDSSKDSSKDSTKDSKDSTKDITKDSSKYSTKDSSKYSTKDSSKYSTKDSNSTKDSKDSTKDSNSTKDSKDSNSTKDSTIFRTCSKCKKVFTSRTLLVSHIKKEHL
ncbi:hypothetical protein NGRA_2293 [Nosema granulosis]|uniref:C2H2-type domain-containing protein n=1 Tax=Nosema granulosis TaxID=83296 RepID=A0A9P6GXA7_9MICR|nr:hypothetical protein NGRA_2293 [Nosema granulosis]